MPKISWNKFKSSKTFFFLIGLSATFWVLIRVIPKPYRASYPCMKAATPLMSSFIIYILGLSATVFSFRKFKHFIIASRYWTGFAFLFIAIVSFVIIFSINNKNVIAGILPPVNAAYTIEANDYVGTARGLYPGRVVWIQNKDATNENYFPTSNSKDYWYSNNNVNPEVVFQMLESSLMNYAETDNIYDAWDAIFKSYNRLHGRGDVGYQAGEKIAFKINLTNEKCSDAERPTRMDATPQLLNAILSELVNVVGVVQSDITMGDPYREFRNEYQVLVKNKFPNVYYVDGKGENGIQQTVPSSNEVLVFSDKKLMSTLPQQYLSATYIINIACLKSHEEGGITLIAKNHQGSFLPKGDNPSSQSAYSMHYSLPANSRGQGKYRHTVDYMGHKQTGGKGLIYIVDGIWGGENWTGLIKKFKSAPFNDDYPNSLFISQDPVALESVCFDVLYEEYRVDDTKQNYPLKYSAEIEDYLLQCASSDYWPEGIIYDPEGDGIQIESLGVFEHWNNPVDRQYSRNLGLGDGIELIYSNSVETGILYSKIENINIAAPNPFSEYVKFTKPENLAKKSILKIYNSNGQLVTNLEFDNSAEIIWDGTDSHNHIVQNGLYIYNIVADDNNIYTGKIVFRN